MTTLTSTQQNGAPDQGFWASKTAPQRTLKIGIIGSGNRGINCFGKLISASDDASVIALCDPNPARMEGAQDVLGQRFNTYAELAAMLGAENLDGVVITSPDYLHAELVLQAIAGGARHILVDKPLATTTADCLRVLAAARATDAQVTVGFNLRFLPLLVRIKKLIDDGELGELMLMENREFYDGGRTYMARWNRFYELSGGLWIHKGSHDFDVFNWWNSGGNPARVMASAGLNALRPDKLPFEVEPDKPVGPRCSTCAYSDICPDYSAPVGGAQLQNAQTQAIDGYVQDLCIFLSEKDTHDNGISIVEYDNNVRASHSECFVCGFTDRIYTVAGTLGTLEARTSRPDEIIFRPRWGETRVIDVPLPNDGGHGGADPLLVERFINGIRNDGAPAVAALDGLRAVAVGQAAELAWREGRSVAISELVDLDDPTLLT